MDLAIDDSLIIRICLRNSRWDLAADNTMGWVPIMRWIPRELAWDGRPKIDFEIESWHCSSIFNSDLDGKTTSRPKLRMENEKPKKSFLEVRGWRHPNLGPTDWIAYNELLEEEIDWSVWGNVKPETERVIPECLKVSTSHTWSNPINQCLVLRAVNLGSAFISPANTKTSLG